MSNTVKIVHCSDLHLDRTFNISNFALAMDRKNDLNRNFSTVVDSAIDRKADLFLITGDSYDRVTPTNATSVFLMENIRRLHDAGIRIFMIGGNHDVPKIGKYTHLAIENFESAGLARVFHKSDTLQQDVVEVNGATVCLSGKSYNTQDELTNPLKGEEIPLDGDYNILLLHAAFRGLGVVSSVPDYINQSPVYADNVVKGLNYLALGHFHNSFVREHRGCLIGNPGSIERLTWNELNDKKGFLWIELEGSKVRWEHIPLKTRNMQSLDLSVTKESGNLNDFIPTFLGQYKDQEAMIRLVLKGGISQAQYNQFRIVDLYRIAQNLFFHFSLDRTDLTVEEYGRIFFERIGTPKQAFERHLEDLIASAEIEDERRLLEKVKDLGKEYLEEST